MNILDNKKFKDVESFEKIFDNFDFPFLIISTDGIILKANENACKIFSTTKEKIANYPTFGDEINGDEKRVNYVKLLHTLTPENSSCTYEDMHVMPDRVIRGMEWRIRGAFNEDGELSFITTYCLPRNIQDKISEQIRVQNENLKKREESETSFTRELLNMLLKNYQLTNADIISIVIEQLQVDFGIIFQFTDGDTLMRPYTVARNSKMPQSKIDKFIEERKTIVSNPNSKYLKSHRQGNLLTTYKGELSTRNALTDKLDAEGVDYKSTVAAPIFEDGKMDKLLVLIRVQNSSYWKEEELKLLPLICEVLSVNHKRSEQEEQNRRWNTLSNFAFEKSDTYTWEYDLNNDCYHNNERFLYRLGFKDPLPVITSDQFLNEMVHPQYLEYTAKSFYELISNIGYKTIQIPLHIENTEKETYEWVNFNCISLSNIHADKPDCVIGTVTFINKQKEYEKAISDARTNLELALEASEMSAWSIDAHTKKIQLIYIYSEKFIKDGVFSKDLLPEDKILYYNSLDQLIKGQKKSDHLFMRVLDKDKNFIYYYVYLKAVVSEETGNVERVIATCRDNTAIKKNEVDLKNYQIKMDMVTRSSGIIFWEYNVIDRIYAMPDIKTGEMKSFTYDEIYSKIHPDDAENLLKYINKLIREDISTINIAARFFLSFVNDYRWLDIHGVVSERDANNRIKSIIGISRDISDEKELIERRCIQDELVRMKEKAEESDRLKSAFLANMSHEIRTPLNSIIGFSNMLSETEDIDERKEYIKIINTNNNLLLQLINDIIDLSKIESGTMAFKYSDFNLNEMLDSLITSLTPRLQEGVEFKKDYAEENCIIHSELNRLEQVLINLISNAIKYTSKGSITVGYILEGQNIRIFVTDTGKGIKQENVSHVFERFSKFDPFVQGTGLGLFICKTIVDSLGGTIGVVSEFGKGSTFWASIPKTLR